MRPRMSRTLHPSPHWPRRAVRMEEIQVGLLVLVVLVAIMRTGDRLPCFPDYCAQNRAHRSSYSCIQVRTSIPPSFWESSCGLIF